MAESPYSILFLWLSNIPLSVYKPATTSLSIHLCVDITVISWCWLWWTVLRYTLDCTCFVSFPDYSYFQDRVLRIGVLDRMVSLSLGFYGTCMLFPTALLPMYISPSGLEASLFSRLSPAFVCSLLMTATLSIGR